MVKSDHAVVLGERLVTLEPVEIGRRGPPVQEEENRSTLASEVADDDRAEVTELDESARREVRGDDDLIGDVITGRDRLVGVEPQFDSTFRTLTVSDPFGAS